MQFVSAFLAGFFFWLMLFRSARRHLARDRQEAGPLLLRVGSARRFVWWWWAGRIILIAAMLAACGQLLWLWSANPRHIFDMHWLFTSLSFVISMRAAELSLFLMLCIAPPQRWDVAFEVRQHGILWCLGPTRFVPWSDISECRWFAVRTILGVSTCFRIPKRFARSCFTIVERNIGRGQRDAVTATIAQHATVYDSDGTLLGKPAIAETPVAVRSARPRWWSRFQFDLQSLMLFVVVVSCIASCYGMHLLRLRPQREALAKLQKFPGSVTAMNDVVVMLDFSKCPRKPCDDDLACLEPLEDLSSLDLTGAAISDSGVAHLKNLSRLGLLNLNRCAITDAGLISLKDLIRLDLLILSGCPVGDAGLVHLEGLHNLKSLSLVDTRVTAKGVARLHQALPHTEISYGPTKAAVVVHGDDKR